MLLSRFLRYDRSGASLCYGKKKIASSAATLTEESVLEISGVALEAGIFCTVEYPFVRVECWSVRCCRRYFSTVQRHAFPFVAAPRKFYVDMSLLSICVGTELCQSRACECAAIRYRWQLRILRWYRVSMLYARMSKGKSSTKKRELKNAGVDRHILTICWLDRSVDVAKERSPYGLIQHRALKRNAFSGIISFVSFRRAVLGIALVSV